MPTHHFRLPPAVDTTSFNTPLEMLIPTWILLKPISVEYFQYSIGDAAGIRNTETLDTTLLSILHWRCRYINFALGNVYVKYAFNTPLEMHNKYDIIRAAINALTFQYSIGDAR